MRTFYLLSVLICLVAGSCTSEAGDAKKPTSPAATSAEANASAATGEPWTAADLLAPAALAAHIRGSGPAPVVFDIGPAGTIKGARQIGPAQEEANLTKLRAALAGLPRDQPVVVYCGCCPFEPCPNIRPAFRLLKAEGFTQAKLLNLPQNLKADWIDPGYPMALK